MIALLHLEYNMNKAERERKFWSLVALHAAKNTHYQSDRKPYCPKKHHLLSCSPSASRVLTVGDGSTLDGVA